MYKMKRLEISGAVRPIYGSLGAKRLIEAGAVYSSCSVVSFVSPNQWRTEGGEVSAIQTPHPRNSEGPPKSCQTQPDCENC